MKTRHFIWTKKEERFLEENYGFLKIKEISEIIKRTPRSIAQKARRMNLKSVAQKEYAVYFDDEFQFTGTAKECADKLGIKKETLVFYTTPSHLIRSKTGVFVVDLGRWKKEGKERF